jgi:hypothetical protein
VETEVQAVPFQCHAALAPWAVKPRTQTLLGDEPPTTWKDPVLPGIVTSFHFEPFQCRTAPLVPGPFCLDPTAQASFLPTAATESRTKSS